MRPITTVLLTLMLAGCAAGDLARESPSSDAAETEPSTSPAPAPTAESTTSPDLSQSPAVAATPELSGAWETTIGGVTVTLTLDTAAGTYRIVRGGNSGAGEIMVEENRIEFFGSSLCSGTGAYAWSIRGDSLRFEPDGGDPCNGRVEVLSGVVYGNYTAP